MDATRPATAILVPLLLPAALAAPLEASLDQGRSLYREGRYEEAKRVLSPLASDAEALYLLGMIAHAQDDDATSAELCGKAARLRPESADYHYCAGNAYRTLVQRASMFRKAGLSKQAREELERAVQLDPRHLDARLALIDFYVYAPSIAGGDDAKALQHAAEASKLDRFEGHRAYARLYLDQKKPDLARKELLEAVREEPQSARAHTALGVFYGTTDEKYEAAIEELELNPRSEPATEALKRLQ